MWVSHSHELLDHVFELETADDHAVYEDEKGKLRTTLLALNKEIGGNPFVDGSEFCLID